MFIENIKFYIYCVRVHVSPFHFNLTYKFSWNHSDDCFRLCIRYKRRLFLIRPLSQVYQYLKKRKAISVNNWYTLIVVCKKNHTWNWHIYHVLCLNFSHIFCLTWSLPLFQTQLCLALIPLKHFSNIIKVSTLDSK